MDWLAWALRSAVFAGLTAILAKVGVAGIEQPIVDRLGPGRPEALSAIG